MKGRTDPERYTLETTCKDLFVLMRLHLFPTGTKLPFAALVLSMHMGAHSVQVLPSCALYTKAALWWLFIFVRHCGGCVWNDMCDRDIDRLVERTKTRPLASGKISLQTAGYLLLMLAMLTLWILRVVCDGGDLFFLGLAGLLVIDMPYPLMKRWANLPQLSIAASMAWPIPIAWLSVTGGRYELLALMMLCIAFGGCAFILDTIYACQDRADDIQIGMKSAAIFFGENIRSALSIFAMAIVMCLLIAGIVNGQGYCYFFGVVGGVAVCLTWQLGTTDFADKEHCKKALAGYSDGINLAIWAGTVGGYVLSSLF